MLKENIFLALQTLRTHKLRSALTLSSVIIGVVCIVVMTSLATSALKTLTRTIDSMGGSRIIFLFGFPAEKMKDKADFYQKGLTRADYELLKTSLPHLERMTVYNSARKQDVYKRGDKQRWNLSILESDNGFLDYFTMKIDRGRRFLPHELEQGAAVCLLGEETAKNMFKNENPIGREVIYGNKRLQVIGVLKKSTFYGISFGFSWNDLVIVPLNPHRPQLEDIVIKTVDSRYNKKVLDIANSMLLTRHNQVDDFRFVDFSKFLDKFYQTFLIINIVVGIIAGVSLLIGGVGVMNMMLVSISERTREIGLRKALGASPRMIAHQFLVESTILSLIGGFVGTILAIGLCLLAFQILPNFMDGWVSVLSRGAIISALVTTVLIGVGFGYYPARQAAALEPVEALRK